MTEREPARHLLGADLRALDAFADQPDQPAELAGRAARALYDDIVWRLAHAEIPAGARARVRALECRAADMVVDFVRRGLPPRYFWADFAAMAHELDGIVSAAAPTPADALGTHQLVARLRRDAAAAALPPAARGRVQAAIARLEEGLTAYEAGGLSPAALQAAGDRAAAAVADAIAALDRLADGGAEARFHRVARAALRAEPAAAHRRAIAARLQGLHAVWDAGGELSAADIDELEALLRAAPAAPFAPVGVSSPSPDLDGAALRLDRAANRVAAAPLPPFVMQAAASILAQLRGLLAERAAGDLPASAFEAAFARGLEAVESCLAFAREVGAERDVAARRVEALVRRAHEADPPPMLAGLLADELEGLRGLMRALDEGAIPLLDFHRAFDDGVEAIERLLTWRAAFHPAS